MEEKELVTIGNADLQIKEYNGQRVITFKDVDTVHGRSEGTARKRFNKNKQHFIENEDYFVLKTDEAKEVFGVSAPNGLVLLTETGYLMLVKSLRDDLSWDVQRQIVNTYFKARQTAMASHNVNADVAILAQSVERLTSMVANLTYRADAIGRQSEKRGTGSEWFRRNITKIHEISKVRGVPFKKIIHEMFECLTLYEYDINAYRETYIEETGRLPEYDLDIVDYFPKLEKRAQQWIDTLYKEADYYGGMCWDDGVIREKEKFKDFLYCGNYKPWKGSKR